MCHFLQINFNCSEGKKTFYKHFNNIKECYFKYHKYLQDDFSVKETADLIDLIININPYFWVVLDYEGDFMGFIYLDNFIGNSKYLYSAELTTCFKSQAWGTYTRYCGKIFLKKCFDELKLHKVKAMIYPDNYRVKNLLKSTGFKYESTLKAETLRNNLEQDIEVYGLYSSYYYKSER